MLKLKERIAIAVIFLIIAILVSLSVNAQTNVKRDSTGTFFTMKQNQVTGAKLTGDYFIDSKGVKYPVWISKSGKYFCVHVSKKTGKAYNHYLKVIN